MRRAGLVATFLALMLMAFVPASAQAPRRVALVIANAAYANAGQLTNPPNDTRLVSGALRRAGFETVDMKANLSVASFRTTLRDFRAKAVGAQVALVYYAGHGIEANGKNWLIPTDAQLNSDLDLPDEAIDLDRVIADVSGADLRVVIVDACRNNPFGRSWRSGTRAVSRGLGAIDADDVLVIFAAAPGQTASDGNGANSPFATALAQRLVQPDLPVQVLGNVVRDDVLRATNSAQRPFVSASMTGELFYLVPRSGGAAVPQPAPTPVFDPRQAELAYWNSCCGAAATAEDFEGYLTKVGAGQFPGTYADTARRRVEALRSVASAPNISTQLPEEPDVTRFCSPDDAWAEWINSIQFSSKPDTIIAFLRRCSRGEHVALAQRRLRDMQAARR